MGEGELSTGLIFSQKIAHVLVEVDQWAMGIFFAYNPIYSKAIFDITRSSWIFQSIPMDSVVGIISHYIFKALVFWKKGKVLLGFEN
jgi:hypothetical protein